MGGSALERALADADRMRMSAKSAVGSGPGIRLAPGPNNLAYQGHQLGLAEQQQLYFRNHVYTAISAIAKRIAGQPLHVANPGTVQRQKSFLDDLVPLQQHPLLDAIYTPNPLMTKWQLMFISVALLELTGKSHWWMPKGRAGREIWPIPTSWIEPLDILRQTYILRPFYGGEAFNIPGDEIAYFSLPDPDNPFWAMGPLQAQAPSVDADDAILQAQARMFRNGIFPSLAVVAGDPLDQDSKQPPMLNNAQRDVIINSLRKMFAGAGKNGSFIILDRLIKDIRKISHTPAEMDFLNSGNQTKSRIFEGFGVNPIVVGQTDNANRAAAVVAENSFVVGVINPLLELMSEVITRWVAPLFSTGRRVIAWIEPARVDDHELTLKEYEMGLKYAMITRNEFRKRVLGLPPVPAGDVFLLPLNTDVVPTSYLGKVGSDSTDNDLASQPDDN